MNRANAVRYGPANDSTAEKMLLLRGNTNFGRLSPHNTYNAVRDLPLHPFASHQILLSCVTKYHLKTVRFLSRNISESVVNLILEYLDTQSLAGIRVTLLAESLINMDISRASSDICSSNSIGSRARSAMSILSHKLFPVNRESAAVQSKDSAQINLLSPTAETADLENQAEILSPYPDLSYDTAYISNQRVTSFSDVISALRKCDALFSPVSGLLAIFIVVVVFVVYR